MNCFHRYPNLERVTTHLDPFDDVIDFLRALTSSEYFAEIARMHPGAQGGSVRTLASEGTSYARLAMDYIDQAYSSSSRVAFLPLYYALLNICKLYVVLGPHRANLSDQRHHGVSYRTAGKESRGLLTEEIRLMNRGAIPLFYKTITGKALQNVTVSMSDIYPYIIPISAEFTLASKTKDIRYAGGRFTTVPKDHGVAPCLELSLKEGQSFPEMGELKTIKRFKRQGDLLVGSAVSPKNVKNLRRQIRPFLVYANEQRDEDDDVYVHVPVSSQRLLMPEELPIVLAFFHMSSVCRYRPQMLDRLLDSRFHTVLLSLQRHAMFRFFVLAWSYIHNKSLFFTRV